MISERRHLRTRKEHNELKTLFNLDKLTTSQVYPFEADQFENMTDNDGVFNHLKFVFSFRKPTHILVTRAEKVGELDVNKLLRKAGSELSENIPLPPFPVRSTDLNESVIFPINSEELGQTASLKQQSEGTRSKLSFDTSLNSNYLHDIASKIASALKELETPIEGESYFIHILEPKDATFSNESLTS